MPVLSSYSRGTRSVDFGPNIGPKITQILDLKYICKYCKTVSFCFRFAIEKNVRDHAVTLNLMDVDFGPMSRGQNLIDG